MEGMGAQVGEEVLGYDHVDICYNGVPVVHDVSASVRPGETLGIVGESGSGKSTLLKAAMGLLGSYGTVTGGDIWLDGRINLTDLPERELRSLCGPRMGMVFQDCISALTPTRRVEDLVWESAEVHMGNGSGKRGHRRARRPAMDEASHQIPRESREQVLDRAAIILEELNVSEPDRVMQSYPFELSGGLGQRVGIMMALLLEPSVLLADEPTSALDVVSQKQVVEQLGRIASETRMAMVLVSHNIGVVRELADQILVLKDGEMVEAGPAEQVLEHPQTAYTKQLLEAVPTLETGSGSREIRGGAGDGR